MSSSQRSSAPTLMRHENLDEIMAALVEIVGELATLKHDVAALRAGQHADEPAREVEGLVRKVFAAFGPKLPVPEAEPA